MSEQAKFLTGSTMRHVVVMSSTASVGLMAVFLVDFIDMVFISMLGKAELAAAVGYAGSILFFTTSVSVGLAIAAGALVSRALGAGDEARARILATHVMAFGFGLFFDEARPGHDERAHAVLDASSFSDRCGGPKVFDTAVGAAADEDVLDLQPGGAGLGRCGRRSGMYRQVQLRP